MKSLHIAKHQENRVSNTDLLRTSLLEYGTRIVHYTLYSDKQSTTPVATHGVGFMNSAMHGEVSATAEHIEGAYGNADIESCIGVYELLWPHRPCENYRFVHDT